LFNDIWAGGVVFADDGTGDPDQVGYVEGGWNVPTVEPPDGALHGITISASSWIGLDGLPIVPTDILQAGVDADVTLEANGVTFELFKPWFEWFPPRSHFIIDKNNPDRVLALPGDTFFCTIYYPPHFKVRIIQNIGAWIFISNLDQGWAGHFVVDLTTVRRRIRPFFNCADWIVERLAITNPNFPELARFDDVTFRACNALTSKGATLTAGRADKINHGRQREGHCISRATGCPRKHGPGGIWREVRVGDVAGHDARLAHA
jgi:hypothetical protein